MLWLALCNAGRGGGAVVQGVSHFGPLLSFLLASVSLCVTQETVPSKVWGEIITEKQRLVGDVAQRWSICLAQERSWFNPQNHKINKQININRSHLSLVLLTKPLGPLNIHSLSDSHAHLQLVSLPFPDGSDNS